MKKTTQKKNNNFNYHMVISDKTSIENFFKSKYGLPFLNVKEKKHLIELRKNKFQFYDPLDNNLTYISNKEIYNALKDEMKDYKTFLRDKKQIPKERIELINFIIL